MGLAVGIIDDTCLYIQEQEDIAEAHGKQMLLESIECINKYYYNLCADMIDNELGEPEVEVNGGDGSGTGGDGSGTGGDGTGTGGDGPGTDGDGIGIRTGEDTDSNEQESPWKAGRREHWS